MRRFRQLRDRNADVEKAHCVLSNKKNRIFALIKTDIKKLHHVTDTALLFWLNDGLYLKILYIVVYY